MVLRNDVDTDIELVGQQEEEARIRSEHVHLCGVLVDQFGVVHRCVNVLTPSNLLFEFLERVQCVDNIFTVEVFAVAPCDALSAVNGQLSEVIVVAVALG